MLLYFELSVILSSARLSLGFQGWVQSDSSTSHVVSVPSKALTVCMNVVQYLQALCWKPIHRHFIVGISSFAEHVGILSR